MLEDYQGLSVQLLLTGAKFCAENICENPLILQMFPAQNIAPGDPSLPSEVSDAWVVIRIVVICCS